MKKTIIAAVVAAAAIASAAAGMALSEMATAGLQPLSVVGAVGHGAQDWVAVAKAADPCGKASATITAWDGQVSAVTSLHDAATNTYGLLQYAQLNEDKRLAAGAQREIDSLNAAAMNGTTITRWLALPRTVTTDACR